MTTVELVPLDGPGIVTAWLLRIETPVLTDESVIRGALPADTCLFSWILNLMGRIIVLET
jgi:hypothetical protein